MCKAESVVARTWRWLLLYNSLYVAVIYNFQEYQPFFKLKMLSTLKLYTLYIHTHICTAHLYIVKIYLKYIYHSIRDRLFGLNPGCVA